MLLLPLYNHRTFIRIFTVYKNYTIFSINFCWYTMLYMTWFQNMSTLLCCLLWYFRSLAHKTTYCVVTLFSYCTSTLALHLLKSWWLRYTIHETGCCYYTYINAFVLVWVTLSYRKNHLNMFIPSKVVLSSHFDLSPHVLSHS